MQNVKQQQKKLQTIKNTAYFSEYETYESFHNDQVFKKNQSYNIIRKLKQLWNRQRYLTDDEYQCSKDARKSNFLEDSSMDYEVDTSIRQIEKKNSIISKNTQFKKSYYMRKHQRVVSLSDQQLNVPQKMKKTKDSNQETKGIQDIYMKGQIQQLASISSAFEEDYSKISR